MLAWLVLGLLAGGLAAWLVGLRSPPLARWVAVAVLVASLVGVGVAWGGASPGRGLLEVQRSWIPSLGVSFHLAMDGLSLAMVLLALVLGLGAVGASWREVTEKVGLFHLSLLWVLAGVVGVFLARDLFLFYLFWELMLFPMYVLIGVWGHEDRLRAAVKFFLFTQAGGLLMLVAIVGLAWSGGDGGPTFGYEALLAADLPATLAFWLMLGFLAGFAVKLPALGLHTWLPDAHTQAPTGGSVILAGLLLKTGGYGLLRFGVPLFPEAAARVAPVAMALGVAGILYGALLAFAQTDLKRLVAYSSVSHMGFVLLGIYAWNDLALAGVVVQMVAHGLATGGLFVLVGLLQERLGTRDLGAMGGFWTSAPRMGAVATVLAMASLGLPGLAGFVGEFLILAGVWQVSPVAAAVAALGLVASVTYNLRLLQRVFHDEPVEATRGGPGPSGSIPDLDLREALMLGGGVALLVWIGLHPQPLLDAVEPALVLLETFR